MKREEIIQKWLSGELSEAEAKAFEADESFALDRKIVASAPQFKAPTSTTSFDEFRKRLYPEQDTKVRKLVPWRSLMKIASVLVIGFALFFIFFNTSELKVQSLAAEKATIALPDTSQVVLNAASTLTYNPDTWENKRSVALKGEAYFKVAKGSRFDVVTQEGVVSVLGTQFTVKQRGSFFEVICYEGLVQVISGERTEKLPPGKTFRSVNGTVSLHTIPASQPSWLDNQTHFDQMPYAEVLAELERQYDVKVNVKNIDTQRIFTGSFVHDNLEAAVKSVSEPLGLSYSINKKQVSLFIRAE
ncbi:FecR family protein [Ascidiimonas sp. W6]|uniref:FecR family protein n=1 Tax=Ascidiimonas meishanensis TaxID=3128903 RepID=UPI0030ECC4F6